MQRMLKALSFECPSGATHFKITDSAREETRKNKNKKILVAHIFVFCIVPSIFTLAFVQGKTGFFAGILCIFFYVSCHFQ